MLLATQLKNNTVFKIENETYVVVRYEHVTQGRGGATIKVKVRNLRTGGVVEKGFNGNDKVNEADVSKASYQFLYADDASEYYMNMSDFDQITLPLSDEVKYLKEGEKVIVVSVDGEPAYIELPKTVDLTVVEADPGVKGNSANNPSKRIKVETGLELQAPMFVKEGDVIKVNTETGEYLSRG